VADVPGSKFKDVSVTSSTCNLSSMGAWVLVMKLCEVQLPV
jgi:hypothetical protein